MSDLKCVRVLLAAADRDIEILQQVRRMAEAEMTRKTNGDGQDRDPTTQNLD